MSKSTYFVIQTLWSLIVSSVIWFLFLMNASFDFYGNSDNTLAGIILFAGAAFYLVLKILYIILGRKKVKEWRAWMIVVSLLICVGAGFLGTFCAVYIPEWINKMIQGKNIT